MLFRSYFGTNGGVVFALDPNGGLRWSKRIGRAIYASYSSPAVTSDGMVFIGSENGRLYGLNKEGNIVFRAQTGKAVHASPALDADGNVYFGSYDGSFYVITKDGRLKWSYKTGGIIESSAALGADGGVYFGTGELRGVDGRVGRLCAFDSNGTLLWTFETEDWIESSPAIGSDGTIYVGSNDHSLYAIGSGPSN